MTSFEAVFVPATPKLALPTPAFRPTNHLHGKICRPPPFWARTVMLFSSRYFRMDTLPAFETFCVLMKPNTIGGSNSRLGITAQAEAVHTLVMSSFTSARISSACLLTHGVEPEAPVATILLFVISEELSRPVSPVPRSPTYTC